MNYFMIELHAHTKHSDGQFSTAELIEAAEHFGYDMLTITDHNTTAPYEEWQHVLSKKAETSSLMVMPGIEWTTYFGHMLVIGSDELIDWRDAKIDTIDDSIKKIKAAAGIVGIAHPFAVGSPICTGCHWDFEVRDWDQVDFIEVWNRTNPQDSPASKKAYDHWIVLLQKGHRLSCTAGRDWHRIEEKQQNMALTYIGLTDMSVKGIKNSLARGNLYMTLGPRIELSLIQDGQLRYMGDEVRSGPATVKMKIKSVEPERLTYFGFEVNELHLIQNEKNVTRIPIAEGQEKRTELNLEPGYLRIEGYGTVNYRRDQLLLVCNPFYVAR